MVLCHRAALSTTGGGRKEAGQKRLCGVGPALDGVALAVASWTFPEIPLDSKQ